MGVWERLSDIYFSLESKYYSFVDWLVGKGVPADKVVTAIEGRGIPSFPIFALAMVLILGGIGYGLYATFGPKTYTITIYDANGNPLANTNVYIDGKLYTTDDTGRISLTGIEGPVSIEVDGYKESSVDPETSEFVYLAPIKKRVVITVLEKGSGKRLAGIQAKVYGENSAEVSGNPIVFYISKVPAENAVQVRNGKVKVEILSTSYKKEYLDVEWKGGEVIEKTVYLAPIAEIVKRGTIVIYVKPSNVSGTAYLYRGDTLVKETPFYDGIARFYSIPYGKYTVKFEAEIGGTPVSDQRNEVDVDHHASRTEAEITLHLPGYSGGDSYNAPGDASAYAAVIHIIDKNTGAPIQGAILKSADGKIVGKPSDKNGIIRIIFSDDNAEMNVYVVKKKYYSSEYFIIRPGMDINVGLVRIPAVGTVLLCVVTPTGDGRYMAVPKAYFKLWNGKWETTGNAGTNGCAEIKNVPAGDVNVYVTDPYGAYPTQKTITVEEDKKIEEKIVLTSNVQVNVNVYALENKNKRVAAVVEAYSANGTKIGEAPTGVSNGATLEIPAKEYVYFIVKYGNRIYQTENKVFFSDQTLNIYVPEKETNAIEFLSIKNGDGDRVFMLAPEKTYDLVLRAVCMGNCSFPISGNGISVPKEVNVSCAHICAKDVTIPITVEANGTGTVQLKVGSKGINIPYGYELSEADVKGEAYARMLAYHEGNVVDPSALTTLTEYNITIPFAAKSAVEDPYVDVSSDVHVSSENVENLGKVGDYSVGIVRFTAFAEKKGIYNVVLDVEGGPEITIRMRFVKEGTRRKMSIDVGSMAVRGCDRFSVPYKIVDANTGQPLRVPVYADIYEDDWLYNTVKINDESGYIDIPTNAKTVRVVFHALGYYDKNRTITLQDVEINTNEVNVIIAPDQKEASADIQYSISPNWLKASVQNVDQDYYGYHVKISVDGLKGTVTVKKDGDTFQNEETPVTIPQDVNAETDQYSCSFTVYPNIIITETEIPVKCLGYKCDDYLKGIQAYVNTYENGVEVQGESDIMSLFTGDICGEFFENPKQDITGTVQIKINGSKECKYNITDHVPLYYDTDNGAGFVGYTLTSGTSDNKVGSVSDGCPAIGVKTGGTTPVQIDSETSNQNNKAETLIYLPESFKEEVCKEYGKDSEDGKVTLQISTTITCGTFANVFPHSGQYEITINCKTYDYYDISDVKLPCASFTKSVDGQEQSQSSCDSDQQSDIYDMEDSEGQLEVTIPTGIENIDSETWYGPYAAILLLHNQDAGNIGNIHVVFGKKNDVTVKAGQNEITGISVQIYDNGKWKDASFPTDNCKGTFKIQMGDYSFCTDSAELAYYFWKQSQGWSSEGDPTIMPVTIKGVKIVDKSNDEEFPNECDGKLVGVDNVEPAALWIDDKTTIFGKTLDDYYRLVAASAGYNGEEYNPGDEDIAKDVPASMIFDLTNDTVISTTPQQQESGFKYSAPPPLPGPNLYRLIVSNGKLYYVKDGLELANGAEWGKKEDLTTKDMQVEYCGGESGQEKKVQITAYLKISNDNQTCTWVTVRNCTIKQQSDDTYEITGCTVLKDWEQTSNPSTGCPETPNSGDIKLMASAERICNVSVSMKYTVDSKVTLNITGWASIGSNKSQKQVDTKEFTEIINQEIRAGDSKIIHASMYDSKNTWAYIFNPGEVKIHARCTSYAQT